MARGAVIALIVELVVLAITGAALFFIYRPTAAQAWDDIAALQRSAQFASAVREVHRAAGRLAIWTALVAAVMVAIEPGNRARWIRSTALGVGLWQVILLASFTGYLLPWDQLALWAVTVGTDMRGYTPMFDDRVRFVLLGGKELGKSTLLRWVFIHMLLLGPAALALAIIAWRRLRTNAPSAST